MKKFSNSCFIILAFAFSLTFFKPVFAGDWVADGAKWKYSENGAFIVSNWLEADGGIYYFDSEGHMATELIKIGKYYHMFHEDGTPYKRNEDFTYNKRYYQIGSRGRINDLETDMNDTEYFKFIVDLRAKRAEEAAFMATSVASPDLIQGLPPITIVESETRELTEQEKRLAAAEEYKRIEKEQAAAAALAEKYRLLSKENREALLTAATVGNDSASASASLMNEFVKQTSNLKNAYVASVQTTLQTNPAALSIENILNEYENIIKEYTEEMESCLLTIRERLSMDNTSFVLMKDSFSQKLKNEKDSLRTQIMGLIK